MATALERLRRRSEFLRVARGGTKWATPGLVLQAHCRRSLNDDVTAGQAVRVGFTASKKVGNAVARNRAKRRLRAVVDEVLPLYATPGHDYVIIGRRTTVERDYEALKDDLRQALQRLGPSTAKRGRVGT